MSELETFFDNIATGTSAVMQPREVRFFVPGIPQPGGSKRGFFNKKLGRVLITDANKKAAPWKAMVSQAAIQEVSEMMDGPLRVRMEFVVPRPKGHYGSGKNENVLKSNAPAFPTSRPDVLKLGRNSEDALTGIVWRDDSQIVTEYLSKRYGSQAGVLITITQEKA